MEKELPHNIPLPISINPSPQPISGIASKAARTALFPPYVTQIVQEFHGLPFQPVDKCQQLFLELAHNFVTTHKASLIEFAFLRPKLLLSLLKELLTRFLQPVTPAHLAISSTISNM